MIKYQAVLMVKSGDKTWPVAMCKIDDDGGVFVAHESDLKNAKKTVSWHRIATLPIDEVLKTIDDGVAESDSPALEGEI